MTDQNTEIPKNFRDWREARRFRAWELHLKRWTQAQIAEALGVTEGAVSQWFKKVREQGLQSLRSRKGGGPKPKLTAEQLESLPELLTKGPEAYGFRGDVWTRARVGAVIKKEFGVAYSEGHVGRLLGKIGWSRQKPTERASQRDEAEIARWNEETWPELKKRPLTKEESSFS
jgi:transposase